MLARALHPILLGLFGAVIIHIAILLLLPVYSERDVWSHLADRADLYAPVRLGGSTPSSGLPGFDNPFFEATACRINLSEGAAHITASGRLPFWSMSIYDRDGLNVYSLNDRSSDGERIDVTVVTSAQMLEIRKALPADFQQSIFAQTDITEGIVVTRVFVPDESWRGKAATFLGSVNCEPL